ncbi:MAG: 3'(2'),5'-bisphosphate nucleotidase CysQ [Hyphomicrobiaceae bacterium]|nr:MAG: 3'(2'),5'-bisphosphate nucleotidase CysQ [Hyphomicrobiaceae bacterium]
MPIANGNDLTSLIVPLAIEAGEAVLRHYRNGVAVETKADLTPVTAADREAEAIILSGLARHFPAIPVVAEESVAEGRIPKAASRFFLVDPLDGTREFVARRGEFTVNIALIDNESPVFGLVYAPATGELCVARDRADARETRLDPEAARIDPSLFAWRPMRARSPDPDGLVVLASRSHLDQATSDLIGRYKVKSLANAGSSLKFCALARGTADFYPRLGRTMEWDTAAGEAVLRAAGGSVSQIDGRPMRYGKASEGYRNPGFLAWGLQAVAPAA